MDQEKSEPGRGSGRDLKDIGVGKIANLRFAPLPRRSQAWLAAELEWRALVKKRPVEIVIKRSRARS